MAWSASPAASASCGATPKGRSARIIAACVTPMFPGETWITPLRLMTIKAVKDAEKETGTPNAERTR